MAAAVLLSACEVQEKNQGGWTEYLIISPATMDSADYIDIADIVAGRTIVDIHAWDSTTGDSVTSTLSTTTITIDASGSTTNHVYNIKVALA